MGEWIKTLPKIKRNASVFLKDVKIDVTKVQFSPPPFFF